MTQYQPCIGCARKTTCETLASVRKAVAGNGHAMSVVRVNCKRAYEADFKPGDRVRVRVVRDWREWGTVSLKARRSLAGYSATVFGWQRSGRVLILLDDVVYWDEADEAGMCRLQSLQHRDIELLGDPARGVCKDCGIILDGEGCPVEWTDSRAGKKGGCQFGGMGCDRQRSPGHTSVDDEEPAGGRPL